MLLPRLANKNKPFQPLVPLLGSEAKKELSTYRIEFVPMDEAAPPTKRHRNETLDLDT